jgi:hypothetical protein
MGMAFFPMGKDPNMSKQSTENYTKSHQNTVVYSISMNYLFGPKAHRQVEHMN